MLWYNGTMTTSLLKQFIRCHNGSINRIIHIVGFALIGIGIVDKSLLLVIIGGITQELGHFYQYAKTRNIKDSPLYCIKPQSLFAYPIFVLIILYVIFAK